VTSREGAEAEGGGGGTEGQGVRGDGDQRKGGGGWPAPKDTKTLQITRGGGAVGGNCGKSNSLDRKGGGHSCVHLQELKKEKQEIASCGFTQRSVDREESEKPNKVYWLTGEKEGTASLSDHNTATPHRKPEKSTRGFVERNSLTSKNQSL